MRWTCFRPASSAKLSEIWPDPWLFWQRKRGWNWPVQRIWSIRCARMLLRQDSGCRAVREAVETSRRGKRSERQVGCAAQHLPGNFRERPSIGLISSCFLLNETRNPGAHLLSCRCEIELAAVLEMQVASLPTLDMRAAPEKATRG